MSKLGRLPVVTIILLAVGEGCSRERASGNGVAAASTPSVATAAASAATERVEKPALTEPGVRELVGKWAAAQSA